MVGSSALGGCSGWGVVTCLRPSSLPASAQIYDADHRSPHSMPIRDEYNVHHCVHGLRILQTLVFVLRSNSRLTQGVPKTPICGCVVSRWNCNFTTVAGRRGRRLLVTPGSHLQAHRPAICVICFCYSYNGFNQKIISDVRCSIVVKLIRRASCLSRIIVYLTL